MAKGPIVTDEVKVLIAAIYNKHTKWKAPEVRNEVDYILHKNNPELPRGWPSLSTVQKVLADVRKKMKEGDEDPRDKSWSTASIAKYPIPPEALPSVLHVWAWVRENSTGVFSIRQAQWVARLYAITKDIGLLAVLSRAYSLVEWLSEMTEVFFINSPNIDLQIFNLMTEQGITPERQKKILRVSDEVWLIFQEGRVFSDGNSGSELFDMILDGIETVMGRIKK